MRGNVRKGMETATDHETFRAKQKKVRVAKACPTRDLRINDGLGPSENRLVADWINLFMFFQRKQNPPRIGPRVCIRGIVGRDAQ